MGREAQPVIYLIGYATLALALPVALALAGPALNGHVAAPEPHRCAACGSTRHDVMAGDACPEWQDTHPDAWQAYTEDVPSDVLGNL